MGYIAGADRGQTMLLPARVEDYVGPEALVRVIDAFVDSLDLHKLGFERTTPEATGRPGYDPRLLLRLYIWGYINDVRSSRRLERACRANLELIWLLGTLAPDFKTIADFRRDNHAGLIGACRAFVLFGHGENLFHGTQVTIDGTKVQAVASRKRIVDKKTLEAEIVALDGQIAGYLEDLNAVDAAEPDAASPDEIRAAVTRLKAQRGALLSLAAEMSAEERRLGVRGEPEARPMGKGSAPKLPSYNLQIAVDPDSHMIVHHALTTDANDSRQLEPMATAAQGVLAAPALQAIADGGYANATQVAACDAHKIEAVVPAPRVINRQGDYFTAEMFHYDAATDSMTCPAGRTLLRNGDSERDQERRYRAETSCKGCPLKAECTKADRRYVYRHIHHEALQDANGRALKQPELMKLRRCTAEHPFATLKQRLGRRFLLRGTMGAEIEAALAVLGYNLMRARAILGQEALIERLLAWSRAA